MTEGSKIAIFVETRSQTKIMSDTDRRSLASIVERNYENVNKKALGTSYRRANLRGVASYRGNRAGRNCYTVSDTEYNTMKKVNL